MKSDYDEPGLVFDPGATRVERLGEAVVIAKRLLEGESVTFAGRHYRVTNHTIHPLPVQRPRPPIFIGGSAPRLLALAAKEADIVGLTGIAFRRGGAVRDVSDWKAAVVDERVRLVREVAGDRYARLELNALVQRVVVTDDRRKAAEELGRRWQQLSPDDLLESPYVLIGATKRDWTAYLNKSVLGMGGGDTRKGLHEFLKFGKAPRSRRPDETWNEFIFQAYHHHQTEAIFLTGLPEVKGSLPHA